MGVSSTSQKNVERYSRWLHFDCEFTVLGEGGAEQGTFKISSFETLPLFYRLGALGAYHGALLGLCLDLFGGILVSLGAILATLWPSLGYLRLYLGCLVLGQPWKPFVMNVIVIFFGLIISKYVHLCVCVCFP